MKNVLLVLLTVFLFNCSSDDSKPEEAADSPLLGKWKIIEQLLDPGDGSGVFEAITSDRTIEFFSNGKVTANGVLCHLSTDTGAEGSGTFNEEKGSFYDGEIIPNDCNFSGARVFYKFQGSNLILWYQCIEECGQKFIRAN